MPRPGLVLALAAVAVVGVVAAGCGGGSGQSAAPTVIASGQIPRADLPTGKNGALAVGSANTIPLAKQDPTTALFSALGVFQSCLSAKGVTFVGAPNPSDPSSPANNPSYLKNLTTCAAQSHILQALKAAQTAQDNLTPTQVKAENKLYLKWRTCMISRGWGIPEPKPNTKGLLFSFGGTGNDGSQYKPPPGQSLLSSSDLQECAAKAEAGTGSS
jgi:hypothetical protein